jgi:hypothetical protein
MATGSFTAVGNSATVSVGPGQQLLVEITGVFVATIYVDKQEGTSAWATVATIKSAGGFDSSQSGPGAYRLRCFAYTSGTATYSITSSTTVVDQGPAILRGSYDISRAPGLTLGAVDTKTRGDNGTALISARNANTGRWLEDGSGGRLEYICAEVESGRNVGFMIPREIRGLIGQGMYQGGNPIACPRSLWVNYAVNHPVLTFGSTVPGVDSFGSRLEGFSFGHGVAQQVTRNGTTANGTAVITGLASTADLVVGYQVTGAGIGFRAQIQSIDSASQVTLTANSSAAATVSLTFRFNQADGVLFGNQFGATIDMIEVTQFADGTNPAFCAMRFGKDGTSGFFSNRVGTLFARAAQMHLLRFDSVNTGISMANVYCGGGGFGNRVAVYDVPVMFNSSGTETGQINQLNAEWIDAQLASGIIGSNSNTGLVIGVLHLEGNKLNGFNAQLVGNASSFVKVGFAKYLNNWIGASTSGVPTIYGSYDACKYQVEQQLLRWDGAGTHAEATCSVTTRMYTDDASVVGRIPQVELGQTEISGNTGTFDLDGTLPTATYGKVTKFSKYVYNRSRSTTEGAVIENSGNADFTFRPVHRDAKVLLTGAITADRTLTAAKLWAASGFGSGVSPLPGQRLRVHRAGSATGAFNWLVKDSTNTNTLLTLAFNASGTEGEIVYGATEWVAA